MVQFNELRITQDNKNLIIDVSIKPLTIYDDVYIDSIIIDSQDTYKENGPSSNPVYTYTVNKITPVYTLDEPVYTADGEDSSAVYTEVKGVKNVRLVLDNTDLALNNKLFFVYVIATGTPDPSIPCGMDNSISVMPVFNTYNVYQQSMSYIRSIENTCEIPKNFIDYILRLKALELSLNTNNYLLSIRYWNKFFKDTPIQESINTCNCYGKTI